MNNKHILVIEDEVDIRELINYNLSKDSYKVSEAGSGEAGIEAAKKLKQHLNLLKSQKSKTQK